MENNSTNFLESINRDIKLTVDNYSHLQRRLSLKNTFTEIILVAYSVFSIFNDLIPHFFELPSEKLKILEFFNIAFSIVFLYFALQVGFAKYAGRCSKLEVTIQKLKFMSQDLKTYSDKGMDKDDYSREIKKYRDIIDGVEIVPLRDYYKTCKKLDANSVFIKFSLTERIMCILFSLLEMALSIFVVVAPIILYLFVFFIRLG